MTEYCVNGQVHGAQDWTIQSAPCNILVIYNTSCNKMANQITSGQLIGLSTYALTKPNNCHPAAHNIQKCQNSQTINFHISIYWHCIFMATEVISQTTHYHVYSCASLTCTAFYTQRNAMQYHMTFTYGFIPVNYLIKMHNNALGP